MAVYKMKNKTRDGKCWKFRTYSIETDGTRKPYKSKNYTTKKEAEIAEILFFESAKNNYKIQTVKIKTMGELREAFVKQRSSEVRKSTFEDYSYKANFFKSINNIKIKDFDFQVFNKWKEETNAKNYKFCYKNDIYKFLRAVMNYGIKI